MNGGDQEREAPRDFPSNGSSFACRRHNDLLTILLAMLMSDLPSWRQMTKEASTLERTLQ